MLKYSKKWSILIVNYRSSVYLKWQLKILYEFNDINDFELIIIDNSVDENEKNNLLNLISDYQKEFNNIKLHFYQPHNKTASGQHGEAIEYAKQYIEGQYLLIHDPDFFWLKKNYLNTLENLLKNHVAVGAPYKGNSMNGNSKFPSAFGCAYKFSDVKNISFEPFIDGDFEKSWEIFNKFQNEQHQIWKNNPKLAKINYDFSFDVGWQIRNQLSNEDNDDNFITFNQFNIKNGLIELLNLKIWLDNFIEEYQQTSHEHKKVIFQSTENILIRFDNLDTLQNLVIVLYLRDIVLSVLLLAVLML